jgi:hypothetical protein
MTPVDHLRGSAKELRRNRERLMHIEDNDVIQRLTRLEMSSTLQNRQKIFVGKNDLQGFSPEHKTEEEIFK